MLTAGGSISIHRQPKNGVDGKSIGRIIEYYLATSASSGVTHNTAGWETEVQQVSSANKYLWNYEETYYTNGTLVSRTEPCVIGTYGNDGRGISHVVEHYLASELSEGVTVSGFDWDVDIPEMTPVKRYLWNYEEIMYSSGSPDVTDPVVIGVYGDPGPAGMDGWTVEAIPNALALSMAENSVTDLPKTIEVKAFNGESEGTVNISSVQAVNCQAVKYSTNTARITSISNTGNTLGDVNIPYTSGSVTITGTASYDDKTKSFNIVVPFTVELNVIFKEQIDINDGFLSRVELLESTAGNLVQNMSNITQKADIIEKTVEKRLSGGNNMFADSAFERGSLELRKDDGTAIRTVTAPDFVDLMSYTDTSAWNGRNYAYINTKMYSGVTWKMSGLTSGTYIFTCKLKITEGFVPDSSHNIVLQVIRDGSEILRRDRTDFGLTSGAVWKDFECSFPVISGYTYSIVLFVYSTGNLSILSPSLTASGSVVNLLDVDYSGGIVKAGVRTVTNPGNVSLKTDSVYGQYIEVNAPKYGGFAWRNLSLKPDSEYRVAFMTMTNGGNVGNLVCQIISADGAQISNYSVLSSHSVANGAWQRHTVTFAAPSSGLASIFFYTSDYGTFGVSEPMLTEGGTEYPWSRGEEDERYMSSKITQTATSILAEVRDDYSSAGMEITSSGVGFTAGMVEFLSSLFKDEYGRGRKYMEISQDENGMPHLVFYTPQGNKAYDLGWEGLSSLIGEAVPASMEQLGLWLVTTTSRTVTAADLEAESFSADSGQTKAYKFIAGRTKGQAGNLIIDPVGADYDGNFYSSGAIEANIPASTIPATQGLYYTGRTMNWMMSLVDQGTQLSYTEYYRTYNFGDLHNNSVRAKKITIYKRVEDGVESAPFFKTLGGVRRPSDATETIQHFAI